MSAKNKTVEPEAVETGEVVEDAAVEEVAEGPLDRELERMLPDIGEPLELSDGTLVDVRPLKIKELFAMFKIITRGSAMSLGSASMSVLSDTGDQFSETLIALLINAIPEADQEFCEFLRIVVEPTPPKGGWKGRGPQAEAEDALDELLLVDPDIGDAIDIITVVIHRESQDIQRLGKKVSNAVQLFTKVNPQKK